MLPTEAGPPRVPAGSIPGRSWQWLRFNGESRILWCALQVAPRIPIAGEDIHLDGERLPREDFMHLRQVELRPRPPPIAGNSNGRGQIKSPNLCRGLR